MHCPKCDKKDDNIKNLESCLPKDQGWIRKVNDIQSDLFFQNPIDRCMSDTNDK